MPFRWTIALAAALAAACSTVTPARAVARCGPAGFAYAGVQADQNGHGIAAAVTALASPAVESGHVAGWVGVGGPGEGPGGTDEWIQAGLNSLPGTGNRLYYEVVRPGSKSRYGEVATDVPTGQPVRIAVLEVAASPGSWRVWVNGRAVTPPIALRGGESLTPMAMGESWDGGRGCNRYRYRFERVSIAAARGGSWQPALESTVLQDPGYRVVQRAPASFDATATVASGVLPTQSPAAPQPASGDDRATALRSPARKP